MIRVERLTAPSCAVGESPVWRANESALYWVDIPARRIHRLAVESGKQDSWSTEEMPACIAFDRNGKIIAGMETGIFSLELNASGATTSVKLADTAMPMTEMRFN